MKAQGKERSPQGAARARQPSAQVGGDTGKTVVAAGDQPSWPRSQQENSSTNGGSEKTKEEQGRGTNRTGKAMGIWEGPQLHEPK